MRAAAAVASLSLIACGDNIAQDAVFAPVSGARIKLEWHLYEDGTRQLATATFFDARFHTQCAPRGWIDGVTRCVPTADDTVFIDAECTLELGRARKSSPTHFLGYERITGVLRPARLYQARERTDPPPQAFELRDGTCVAVPVETDGISFYQLSGLVEPTDIVEVSDTEIGDGRIGLRVLGTADGMRTSAGFRDRDLGGVDCRPEARTAGAACVPIDPPVATLYADAQCAEPVLLVPNAEAVPPIARVFEIDGCAGYRTVGPELTTAPYRRDGTGCVRSFLAGVHAFRTGAPIELAPIERTVEAVPGRRLQRIVVRAGDLRIADDRLFDTAIRAECRRHDFKFGSVCVPAAAAPATLLYANDRCGLEVRVADLPRARCEVSEFAIADAEGGIDVHAIGMPYTAPLYQLDGTDTCRARASEPDAVTHVLGPVIPINTFVGAILIGDR